MKYYDEQCEAHKELKAVVGPAKEPGPDAVMVAYWEAEVE